MHNECDLYDTDVFLGVFMIEKTEGKPSAFSILQIVEGLFLVGYIY